MATYEVLVQLFPGPPREFAGPWGIITSVAPMTSLFSTRLKTGACTVLQSVENTSKRCP